MAGTDPKRKGNGWEHSDERMAAKAAGERYYFAPMPCPHGHISKRYTSNAVCAECQTVRLAIWMAKRTLHPAQIAAAAAGDVTYSTGKPCTNGHDPIRITKTGGCIFCARARVAKWAAKNTERCTVYTREHRRKDPTKHRENIKRYVKKHHAEVKERLKKWKADNPEKARALAVAGSATRKTRKTTAGGRVTRKELAALRLAQNNACAACRGTGVPLEADHTIPVARGGHSNISNIRFLCLPCNRSKGSKDAKEWALSSGFDLYYASLCC